MTDKQNLLQAITALQRKCGTPRSVVTCRGAPLPRDVVLRDQKNIGTNIKKKSSVRESNYQTGYFFMSFTTISNVSYDPRENFEKQRVL